jgi:hypothetical protein
MRGHAASTQLGFRTPGPRIRAETAEYFEGGPEDGLGVVDPPLAPEPLPVVQLKLGPFERPRVARWIGQGRGEMRRGIGGLGEEPASAGRELL